MRDAIVPVSIVMCTYNGGEYLREQLNSVLAQTYPIQEILVFDDASADESWGILQEYAAACPIVHIHRNAVNMGFIKNFEQGLCAATGEMIAICDQDDVWLPAKIEKMISGWDGISPLIHCGSRLFSGIPTEQPRLHPLYRFFEGTDARRIFLRNTVSGHNILFQRSFLLLVLPFPDQILYDWWMTVVAAYNGGVQFYPEILVMQRVHENNVTVSNIPVSKSVEKERHKQSSLKHCRQFVYAVNMPPSHRKFALRLADLLEKSLIKTFYFPLFLFLLRHSSLVFSYKKIKIGLFSYLKHSYRMAKK